MKRIDPIERLLGETPLPHVAEGAHREYLKQRLLAGAQSAQIGRKEMPRFSILKAAAAVAAAAFLIGTGWSAEKIYHKLFDKASVTVEVDPSQLHEYDLPDGQKMLAGPMTMTMSGPDDPEAAQTVKRHEEEIKQLIAQKQYEFVKTFEIMGRKEYVYKFTFADGSRDNMNFSMPLDDVVSWDDYQQKLAQTATRREEQIHEAIAAGRFRLINTDVILNHICRETATNIKYKVQKIAVPDPSNKSLYNEFALYNPFDMDIAAGKKIGPMQQTGWKSHLDAILGGEYELLSKEMIPTYDYEVVLEDGSKTIFSYGGGEPLKKTKAL